MNKQYRTKLLKFIKVFNLPVSHVNLKFILIMLFSSLKSDIAEVSKILTSGK